MESVVNRIIEIDRSADERMSAAAEKEKQILKEADEESSKIKKKLLCDAQDRISQVKAFNKSEFEKDTAELEEKYQEEIAALDAFYKNNHEKIEQEIFAEIVGE
ncbi:hypothetical protein [Porcipelethomonas sp.]|uniref:hypothetical protein n=1 Tax=Porcipelethomonas sp. TaxID=2981675 RepID=UPI003EF95169